MKRTFSGRQMSAILVAGFGVVIAVNLSAAVVAKRTFGGVVVENSYVASQNYNDWLQRAAEQRALGWSVEPHRLADGRVAVTLAAVPDGARIEGEARHPLGRQPDMTLRFGADGVSREALPPGRWTLRLTVHAGGREMRVESDLR